MVLLDQFEVNKDVAIDKSYLYIKAQVETDYSQEIINISNIYKLDPIIDDATEDRVQSITWYFNNIARVPSVLIEFSSMNRKGNEIQNMKSAFLGGVAIGLGKHVVLCAERPYEEAPLDYRNLLVKYSSLSECNSKLDPFFKLVKDKLAQSVTNKKINRILKTRTNIQKISFGEYTAEHESDKVYDYYVNISHIDSLMRNEHNIIVGRKGAGKTATLYYLKSHLDLDIRNYVVLINQLILNWTLLLDFWRA